MASSKPVERKKKGKPGTLRHLIENEPEEMKEMVEETMAWWRRELPPCTSGEILSTRMSW